jgi:hypothetical protein
VAKENSNNLNGSKVYLGLLRSTEYGKLPQGRREAVGQFWHKYFEISRAQFTFATDGPGLLPDHLQ